NTTNSFCGAGSRNRECRLGFRSGVLLETRQDQAIVPPATVLADARALACYSSIAAPPSTRTQSEDSFSKRGLTAAKAPVSSHESDPMSDANSFDHLILAPRTSC